MRTVLVAMAVMLGAGCGGGMIGGGEEDGCPLGADCTTEQSPTQPLTPNMPTCSSDAQCTAPYVCNTNVGKCVPPSSKDNGPCDPIDGKACPSGQQCIAGVCMTPPGSCQNNEDCPVGFICMNGVCTLDGGAGPACKANTDCPAGQVCVSGACKPEPVCKIPHAPDRMKGFWRLDSQLHVRDGLHGFTKGLLNLATSLQQIIEGKFSISGIPSIFTSLIQSTVQKLINQYIPPWGMSVIALLADINDVIDDMRVVSIETLQSVGNDQYVGSSTWKLVEFEYKGAKVNTPPDAIPGLGKVTTEDYTAREVCGTLYLDKHKVKNAIGKVFRWAIDAVVMAVSCSINNGPCYSDTQTMFNNVVDCPQLAAAVAQDNQGQIPGLEAIVLAACATAKQTFVTKLMQELDDLALKMTYMSLAAKADIASAAQLVNGKWYGVLGDALSKGNFEGTFTGQKQPTP